MFLGLAELGFDNKNEKIIDDDAAREDARGRNLEVASMQRSEN